MVRFYNKTITNKMIGTLLLGLIIASILFFVLYFLSNECLDNYFSTSSFIKNASAEKILQLQEYVSKNNIAATDTEELRTWAMQQKISYFTISRERMLLYDNSYTGQIPLEQTESEQLHYTWQYLQPVTFSDGNADVLIYGNYTMKYYVVVDIIIAILSAFSCLGFFVIGIKHEVTYLNTLNKEVSEIEKGNLYAKFTIKGEDELTNLATGLEQMRVALIEKENIEKNMKTAQEKLVLGMAHDLRTPLTSMMTYLEIIKRQNKDEKLMPYLNTTFNKSMQLRDLSDQLFEFFLVNSEKDPEMEITDDIEYPLGDYLSELSALLENAGFIVSVTELIWKNVSIKICTEYLGRIVNNLVSNITKYASKDKDIILASRYTSKELGISIENNIETTKEEVSGTGIGVNNIEIMMKKMGGRCEISSNESQYKITLYFMIIL